MALSGPDEVLAALADGKPGELLGMSETDRLDFKDSPYKLDTPKDKVELGKDVAALANWAGGVLVIGVRTKKSAGNFSEYAEELRPVPIRMLNKDQYHSIIRDIVRPASVRVTIKYFEDPDQSDKGYMTIHVLPLPAHERYALLRRIYDLDGKLVDAVNIPIRDGDQTRWFSADEVYRIIQAGQQANVPRNTEIVQPRSAEPRDWDGTLDLLIAHKDWESSPVLAWQSMPTRPVDLASQFWGKGSISEALRRPGSLRSMGFNWSFLSDISQFEDGILTSDGRHAIWIREDGAVTAVATVGNNDMLGWAMSNSDGQSKRLNVIALCELTLEYFRLVDEHVVPASDVAYAHSVVTRKFSEEPPVILSPGRPTQFPASTVHQITRDKRRSFDAASPIDSERDTFEALRLLYTSFQYGLDQVPFVKDERFETADFLEWNRIPR